MLETTITIIVAILGFEDGMARLGGDSQTFLRPGDLATVYQIEAVDHSEHWTRLGAGTVVDTGTGLALVGVSDLVDEDPSTLRARFETAAERLSAIATRPTPEAETETEAEADTRAPTREPPSNGLTARVHAWADAWADQRVDDYLGFYADAFVPPPGQTRDDWTTQRRWRITQSRSITITLEALGIRVIAPERAEAVFLQRYQSDTFSDAVDKRLELIWERDDWHILREEQFQP